MLLLLWVEGVVGRVVVGRGGCGSRVEGRGLWVRVRGGGGRGGYSNCYFKMGCGE